jgi:hypothetical protein
VGLVAVVLVVAALAGCAYVGKKSPRPSDRVRQAVLEGARRDFRHTVALPRRFQDCFLRSFGHALTDERLAALAADHERRGESATARALNALGAPVGDYCGGREWVPELTGAAEGLRLASPD